MNLKKTIKRINNEPLSIIMPVILMIAKKLDKKDFENWLKLELNGYFDTNPALTDESEVPKYRTVIGQHYNNYGRQLEIQDSKLSFINTTRLRYSVGELEMMEKKDDFFSIQDQYMCKLIHDNLGVIVTNFKFHSSQIITIISSIKTELVDRVIELWKESDVYQLDNQQSNDEDIILIKPNFYGIGLDINALFRKWRLLFKKNKQQ